MNILDAATIARFAYSDPAASHGTTDIELKNGKHKYDYKFLDVMNTQCYVLEDDENVIFTIRGSKEFEDFADTLKVWGTDVRYMPEVGEVHSGFYEGVTDIILDVTEIVNHTNKKVFFIGHSLGGSVAKLLGLRFKEQNVTVYTFGEARSCKKKTSAGNSKFIRVVNNCDLVPRLHVRYKFAVRGDTFLYINTSGKIKKNPSKLYTLCDVLLACSLRLVNLRAPFESITDHLMTEYIRHLDE